MKGKLDLKELELKITMILCVSLLFVSQFSYIVHSSTDVTGPVITDYGVVVSPEMFPGDKVTFWLKGTDSESGVFSCMMQLGFQGQSANFSVYGKYNVDTDICEGSWEVSNTLFSRGYYIDYLTLYDADSNPTNVKLSNVMFDVVTDKVADLIAPVVTDYYVSINAEMKLGDTVSYWIEGTDDESGIYGCSLEWGPINNPRNWMPNGNYVIDGNRCAGSFTIPSNIENGTYVISRLYLGDQQGNAGKVDLSDYIFTVSGATLIEKDPPVITSFSVDVNRVLKPGDTITAEVEGYDTESGLLTCGLFIGYVSGQWDNMIVPGTLNKSEGLCYLKITIPQDFKIGNYRVYKLSLADRVGNGTFVDLPNSYFDVVSVFEYDNSPVLKDTAFSPIENVVASSPFDGDMTNSLSVIGTVDTSTLGLFLLKYSVTGKNNFVYRDYRWVTILSPTTNVEESTETIYFNEPIEITIPSTGSDSVTLDSETGNSILSGTTAIEKDGTYSVTIGSGSNSSNFQTENLKLINVSTTQSTITTTNRIKFVIDKKAPIITGVINNESCFENTKITFNEGTATLNGRKFISGDLVNISGTYTLVVTDKAGNTTQVSFTVSLTNDVPVTGVVLNKNSLSFAEIGLTEILNSIVNPNNATNKNVIWMSSNEEIATVSSDGIVTSVGVGTATITVTTENGNKTDSLTVTVATTLNSVPEIVNNTPYIIGGFGLMLLGSLFIFRKKIFKFIR